ncbi:Ig-like domain-containing protein [Agrobacterium sp. AGB01]|uniref:Ig-like domain-containing protein n=1 Tax=Agrobacterium sp. AGB01 TaxID=2769302 RepID=UPI001786A410|nr:Ig-like domain-containing protein [Agrobacterium sp. AGB01]MBD9388213.1 Ig-like domain-containing protein [Agrobacterium sp. AGB01]
MAKPTAVADFDTIYLNDPDGSISGNITANDSADGGAIYLRSLNGSTVGAKKGLEQITIIEGTYGTFKVSPNGNYTYTLHPDIKEVPAGGLVERVGYKVSDGGGRTDFDYLTITIKGEHTKPVAVNQTVEVSGNFISGDLTAENHISVSRLGGENFSTANHNDYILKFVQPDGSTVINGLYGDLHIERSGAYTYTLNEAGLGLTEAATERFQFRIYDDAFGEFDNAQTTDVGVLKISIPALSTPDLLV